MEITYSPEFIPTLKNKYLLLDTNVFFDYIGHSREYTVFFNRLKESHISLATIDAVKYEILKGAADSSKYSEKEELVQNVIDRILPFTENTTELIYSLIKEYKREGYAPSVTDFSLGAMLKQYGDSLYLMTRDTTDFSQSIFDLKFIVNASHTKGIFTYGIYQIKKPVAIEEIEDEDIPF